MLNKISVFEDNLRNAIEVKRAYENEQEYNLIKAKLEAFYTEKGKYDIKIPKKFGRCSYTYILCNKSEEKDYFIKCCLPGKQFKNSLSNEFQLMSSLYDDEIEWHSLDEYISFIVMKKYYMLENDFDVGTAQKIICNYQKKLVNIEIDKLHLYDITDLLTKAIDSLGFLKTRQRINENYSIIRYLLKYLESELVHIPRTICHGDFGYANCLQDINRNVVLVDWEDAFLGIDSYDFFYWMTFFSHNIYYKNDIWGGEKRQLYIALTIMIIILKEYVSFINGEYKRNSMSTDQRISSVLQYL